MSAEQKGAQILPKLGFDHLRWGMFQCCYLPHLCGGFSPRLSTLLRTGERFDCFHVRHIGRKGSQTKADNEAAGMLSLLRLYLLLWYHGDVGHTILQRCSVIFTPSAFDVLFSNWSKLKLHMWNLLRQKEAVRLAQIEEATVTGSFWGFIVIATKPPSVLT